MLCCADHAAQSSVAMQAEAVLPVKTQKWNRIMNGGERASLFYTFQHFLILWLGLTSCLNPGNLMLLCVIERLFSKKHIKYCSILKLGVTILSKNRNKTSFFAEIMYYIHNLVAVCHNFVFGFDFIPNNPNRFTPHGNTHALELRFGMNVFLRLFSGLAAQIPFVNLGSRTWSSSSLSSPLWCWVRMCKNTSTHELQTRECTVNAHKTQIVSIHNSKWSTFSPGALSITPVAICW